VVADARPGSAFAVMTHEHSLDFLITAEILKRGDAAYCGMIGSATKRKLAERWMAENGYDTAAIAALTCPIGGDDVRDKRPQIIALLTAAEIVRALHRYRAETIA
jgi:xanthine dehydrogenase accessory factor